ncbi:MAG: peptidase T [Candidatus Riflebacteria bacterium]|nr:peptidase T [Candidatus Riflebacteria bacterium]
MKEKLLNRFLSYVTVDTMSDETNEACPSTQGQFELAKLVEAELKKIGLEEVVLDDNCYLTAKLPANEEGRIPVGFIAHFDTAPDCSGKDVKPQVIRGYKGGDIPLGTSGISLNFAKEPYLEKYIGHDLITTDGTTLLGADDKAGVAEIVTAVEMLKADPSIKHGDIYIGFTPDEEIGRGADKFPLDRFKAEIAYTIDGGAPGELQFENFNAASAKVIFKGVSVHPGSAKDIMINSQGMAAAFHCSMPKYEVPENTEEYEGFYHLTSMSGNVERSELHYIIRDFSESGFEERKNYMREKVQGLKACMPLGASVSLEIKDSYRNMKEIIDKHKDMIDKAKIAITNAGVTPMIVPIRGGTDGARLSFMGLPCPNIFTGGHNFHGKLEYISLDIMTKAVKTILNIAKII